MSPSEFSQRWPEIVGTINATYSYPIGEFNCVLYVVATHEVTARDLSISERILSQRAGVRRTQVVTDSMLLDDEPFNPVHRLKSRAEICREVPDVLHQFVRKHDLYEGFHPKVARRLRRIRKAAKTVFGSGDKAEIWLNRSRWDIPDQESEPTTAIQLLETEAGAEIVDRLLADAAVSARIVTDAPAKTTPR